MKTWLFHVNLIFLKIIWFNSLNQMGRTVSLLAPNPVFEDSIEI